MACPRFLRWLKSFSESFANLQRGRKPESPGDILRFRPGQFFELESRYVTGNLLMPLGWEFFGTPSPDTYVSGSFAAEEPAWEVRQTSVANDDAVARLAIAVFPTPDISHSEENQPNDSRALCCAVSGADTLPAPADSAVSDWFADFADPLALFAFANPNSSSLASAAITGGIELPESPSVPHVGGGAGSSGGPVITAGGGAGTDGRSSAAPPSSDFGPMPGAPGSAVPVAPLGDGSSVMSSPRLKTTLPARVGTSSRAFASAYCQGFRGDLSWPPQLDSSDGSRQLCYLHCYI